MNEFATRLKPTAGTYAVVFHCPLAATATAGSLGEIRLSAGYWIYVGSAFGPGGLRARLAHHLRSAVRPHWHLDYIKHALAPIELWTTGDPVKREHVWAATLSSLRGAVCPIPGFGASDCTCRSHLIRLPRRPGFDGFRKRIRTLIKGHCPLIRTRL